TSMLKRVDNAVFNTFSDAMTDSWSTGFNVNGLAENGVGFAMDDNNAELVSADMLAAVEAAAAAISAGEIEVHDYTSDGACPY
ncbi:MAG: BMP family ABC transporter substrate-binding protein, partial [Pseudomonadota bacterium]